MKDSNETKYVEMILSIIDYEFIRKTDNNLEHMSDDKIKQLFVNGKDDIIVSNTHAQLVVQNDLFDYEFYKSHYDQLVNMTPTNVLNHYLLYGKTIDIVSPSHAQQLTKTPHFNIDFYKLHNHDLHTMNPRQLVNHYIGFGKKEGRRINI